ncbi:MOP flippase [Tricholoma matsutake]|nr:MOP flippase [Tricholoma matsutake 945]
MAALYDTDEREPLLHGASVIPQPPSDFSLFCSLLFDSIPVILSYTLQNSLQAVSILIVAQLGPAEFSAASVALMLAFDALDTLGSQSFTGGSHPTDLSIHLQRCIVLLWALLVPVCILWAFMEPILLGLGQPKQLSKDVQMFLRVLIIGAPGYIGFESLKKYLQCQGIMRASTMVLIVVFPINVALNIILIQHTPLGLLGCSIALSVTYWLSFGLLALYTTFSPTHKANGTWGGIKIRLVLDFSSCVTFLKLAIPGILMVGTEWAAFEIVALAAGRLGELPLAAQAVIMTTDQILNTIPFGIGVAASTRVGNLLGSRSAVGAKRASHVSAFLSVVVGSTVMTILMTFKDKFGYVFSEDVDVVRLVSRVMPYVASFQIADGLVGSCGGVLRGQGRQHIGALFNLAAYYLLALPVGITLAFNPRTRLGLEGLWIGQVLGLFVVGIGEYCAVWLGTDWDKEVQRSIDRSVLEAKLRSTVCRT